jgi:hypothetical protein
MAERRIKKGPGGCLEATTEADQPGMGMTNRVIPAQGEERGASLTLVSLDGDVMAKFQPHAGKKLFCPGSVTRLQRNVNKCLKSRKNPVKIQEAM